MKQIILHCENSYAPLDTFLEQFSGKAILLVHDSSLRFLRIKHYLEAAEQRLRIKIVSFSDFQPNPLYESVVAGVARFHQAHCQAILAVGGGSAIDVAKCIKLYAMMDPAISYLCQQIQPNAIPLAAMPTTAGTGSEATRYAVIYANGEKQSITHESCIPQVVVLDPSVLSTLPVYQKKATMLDALCHAIESYWSVNSTEQSRQLSRRALMALLKAKEAYLKNDPCGNAAMQEAANLAGQAINITQTTAGHAMCYKLTSMFGIAHGHAAALCVEQLWPYMIEHLSPCTDPRGSAYLEGVLQELANCFGEQDSRAGAYQYRALLNSLELQVPTLESQEQLDQLADSVNPVRLKNNPVPLTREKLYELYKKMLA